MPRQQGPMTLLDLSLVGSKMALELVGIGLSNPPFQVLANMYDLLFTSLESA